MTKARKKRAARRRHASFGPAPGRPWRSGLWARPFFLYAVLVLAPGAVAFAWAFTRWDGIGARTWVGLFNFKSLLFENDVFWFA